MVWFVVLQESRITASAAVPPTPQSSFSRLPWIHRVSLDRHTNGEYCKKDNIVTTHFFGKNEWQHFAPESSIQWRLCALNGLRDTHSEIFPKPF